MLERVIEVVFRLGIAVFAAAGLFLFAWGGLSLIEVVFGQYPLISGLTGAGMAFLGALLSDN